MRTKEDDQLREMIALSKERDRQQELMQSGASKKEAAATAAAEAEVRNLCLLAHLAAASSLLKIRRRVQRVDNPVAGAGGPGGPGGAGGSRVQFQLGDEEAVDPTTTKSERKFPIEVEGSGSRRALPG